MWKELLVPPSCCFALAAVGLLVRMRRKRTGRLIVLLAALLLAAFALPFTGGELLVGLQDDPALADPRAAAHDAGAGAIVVLGAEVDRHAPEYGGPTAGDMSLVRLRYAAKLARETGLPILVTGGHAGGREPSQAEAMATVLRDELGVEVRWIEGGSLDTRGNAELSAALLARDGVRSILLVTHAWHMRRARAEFERHGLEVLAAPTGIREPPRLEASGFVPSWKGLRDSALAIHEWIGGVWYRVTG
jgi:uncharacterized SAM-binding protein YcdF (DUF218 family)